MLSQIITIAIGSIAGIVGIVLMVVALHLASSNERTTVSTDGSTVLRPGFALETPEVTGGSRPDGASVLAIRGRRLAAITAESADFFEVPLSLLDHHVSSEMRRDRAGEWILDAVPRERLQALNLADEPGMVIAVRKLAEMLGKDPRPFDSHVSRQPELGIPARAAYLFAQYETYRGHLEALDLTPSREVVWACAYLATERGERETTLVIEEAIRLGPRRLGRAFLDAKPTLDLITDDSFVLRAFLHDWPEWEARKRGRAFREAGKSLDGKLDLGEPPIVAAPSSRAQG